MTGAELIVAERQRQIDIEGWSDLHDDHHADGSLLDAALCYANCGDDPLWTQREPHNWPWDSSYWKPKTHIRNLVIAGALIAAEIDRLQRAVRPQ